MAVYKVLEAEDEILRKKAKEVPRINRNIHKLLDNMKDTMYEYRGVGLAAPQVGVSKKVIVVDAGDRLIELVNPEIMHAEGSETATEGCLSVPGIVGDVTRSYKTRVKGQNREGEEVDLEAEGFLARVLQHEIDHLHGVLFTDKAFNLRKES